MTKCVVCAAPTHPECSIQCGVWTRPGERCECGMPAVVAAQAAPAPGKPGRLDGRPGPILTCYNCGHQWEEGRSVGLACPSNWYGLHTVEKPRRAEPGAHSGQRTEYATGAVRDNAVGRGRPDLISPIMLNRLAIHLEKGALKYAERNWERGLQIARCFASLWRHSWKAFMREEDEDHMAAVVCNAMFIIHLLEMIARGRLPADLDNRPDYSPLVDE